MSSKMDRFTTTSRQVLVLAQEATFQDNKHIITVDYLLLAMTRRDDMESCMALQALDIVEAKLMPFFKHKKKKHSDTSNDSDKTDTIVELSEGVKRVLELSVDTARRVGDNVINSGHMLIGVMRYEESPIIDDILDHFDVSRDEVIQQAHKYLHYYSKPRKESALIAFIKASLTYQLAATIWEDICKAGAKIWQLLKKLFDDLR